VIATLITLAIILGAYACLGVLFWIGACLFGGQLRQWSPREHLHWMLWLAVSWVVLLLLFAEWSPWRVGS
jgi:predicted tellurium resistance membrane protein TerC